MLFFSSMMKKHCNVVLSYVNDWDLNFLFFECFYLGIPLIHNAKMLKNYGYYYEGKNMSQKFTEHIKNLKINGFDRDKYINKHKELIHKYSFSNPDVISFFKNNLKL